MPPIRVSPASTPLSSRDWIRVPISLFSAAMGFCEYQAILLGKGIRPISTESMRKGSEWHASQQKKQSEEEKVVSISFSKAKQLVLSGKPLEFAWEGALGFLKHEPFLFVGRIDQARFLENQNGFEIIEHKTTQSTYPRIYPNELLQGTAYALILANQFNQNPLNGTLTIHKTNPNQPEKELKESFSITIELQEWFHSNLNQFEQLYQGKIEAEYCQNQNKCRACNPAYQGKCNNWQTVSATPFP